jgi:hypothetical protein
MDLSGTPAKQIKKYYCEKSITVNHTVWHMNIHKVSKVKKQVYSKTWGSDDNGDVDDNVLDCNAMP